MDSGHFGAYAAWLLLYWVQLWRLRCLIGDLIGFSKALARWNCRKFLYVMSRWQHQESLPRRQEFLTGWLGRIGRPREA